MDDRDELVEVKVLVPRERLAEFYEQHAQWLREEEKPLLASAWSSPDHSSTQVVEEADERPWLGRMDGDDIADAINIYDKLSVGAKKIIDILLAHPGEKICGDSLAKQLDLSQAQLTGTLASLRIRSKAVRREVPFRYESGTDGGNYWIEPEIASLFSWARNQPSDIIALALKYHDYRQRFWDSNEAMSFMPFDSSGIRTMPDALENRVFLGIEKSGYELERAFRVDMNQLEPEIPEFLRNSWNKPESEVEGVFIAYESKE